MQFLRGDTDVALDDDDRDRRRPRPGRASRALGRAANGDRAHAAMRSRTHGGVALERPRRRDRRPARCPPSSCRCSCGATVTSPAPCSCPRATSPAAAAGSMPVAPGRLVARLELDGGLLAEATIDRAADGMPARVVDGEGVIALRITEAQAPLPFARDRPRRRDRGPDHRRAAAIASCSTAISSLPALPGQATQPRSPASRLELGAHLPGALPPPPSFGPNRSRREIRGARRERARADHAGSRRDADVVARCRRRDRRRLHDVRARLRRARHAPRDSDPRRHRPPRRRRSPGPPSLGGVVDRPRVDRGRRRVRRRAGRRRSRRARDPDADDAGLVAGEAALTTCAARPGQWP